MRKIWNKLGQTSLVGDFAVTMVFAVLQLLLAPVSTSILARYLGAHDFGTYSSLQRLVLFASPLASLGVSVGVTRYVSTVRDRPEAKSYFWSAVTVAISGSILFALLSRWLQPPLFGDAETTPPTWLLLLLLFVLALQKLLGSWLRGSGAYFASNSMLLLAEIARLSFLMVLFISGWQIEATILLLAVMLLQLTVDMVVVGKLRPINFSREFISLSRFRVLLRYSAPRVPGGLSLQALNSIGVFYFALNGNNRAAGYMALSMVILNAGSMVFSRLGSILMPHLAFELSKSTAENQNSRSVIPANVQRQLSLVIDLLMTVAVIVGVTGILGIPPLVVPWLGADFAPAELPISVLSSSVGLMALYSVLSGAINAADTRPINTLNLAIVLAASIVLLLTKSNLSTSEVAWIQATGYALLSLLTVFAVCRLYGIAASDAIGTAFVTIAVFNVVTAWLVLQTDPDNLARAITIITIGIADLIIIRKFKPPWFQALAQRFSFLQES